MNTQQEIKDLAYNSVQSEYEKVMAAIKEAARKGFMSVYIGRNKISDALVNRLQDEGFDIDSNKVSRIISWR